MPGPAGGIGFVQGPDPCRPKGPGGYDYCQNGPGGALPAGCVCQTISLKASTSSKDSPEEEPAPETQTPLTANATDVCAPMGPEGYIYCARGENDQTPECGCSDKITLPASADSGCQSLLQRAQKLPKFNPNQVRHLKQVLGDTRTMLLKAKRHVDLWDPDAQWESGLYFGNSDPGSKDQITVKEQISIIIDAELDLLNNMNDVEQHIFPDLYYGNPKSPIPSWSVAYVIPQPIATEYPMIFLPSAFWKESNDYKLQIMVHELAHMNTAGGAEDLAYGSDKCIVMTMFGNLSKPVAAGSGVLKSLHMGTPDGFSFVKPIKLKHPDDWDVTGVPTPRM